VDAPGETLRNSVVGRGDLRRRHPKPGQDVFVKLGEAKRLQRLEDSLPLSVGPCPQDVPVDWRSQHGFGDRPR
jgi:hypothetical protein